MRLLLHHRLATILVLIAHLALVLALYSEAFVRIDGEAFALLGDDEFISMVYARQVAQHGQLVWSDGQRVEGFSNLLWTLIMAVTHFLPLAERLAALPILLLNVLLVPLSALLAASLAARMAGDLGGAPSTRAVAAIVAASAVLLNFSYLNYAAAGSEGPLAAVFLLLAWHFWERLSAGSRSAWPVGVFLGLAALTRTELGLFLCAVLAVVALYPRWRQRALRALLITGAVVLAMTLWRIVYYGDVLPNTYYLKVYRFPHRWHNGLRYAVEFLVGGGGVLLLVLGAVGVRGSSTARIAALCAGLFILYIAYLGGDALPLYQLYAPIFPVLVAPAAAGLAHVAARIEAQPHVAVVLGAILLVVGTNADSHYYARALSVRRWKGIPNPPTPRIRENIILAKWLNVNTPPEARIAVFMAGALTYFCERLAVDMLGRSEPHIARLPAGPGRVPGHNKYDFDYVVETLRPDYILGERLHPSPGTAPPGGDPRLRDYGFVDALAYSEALQRDYEPLAAEYPSAEQRTLYVRCDQSGE